jgi:hypothetical protein
MVTIAQMKRKSIDNDIAAFRAKAYRIYGRHAIRKITFGDIRNDGTRYAKVHFRAGGMVSFSYLTDLSNRMF